MCDSFCTEAAELLQQERHASVYCNQRKIEECAEGSPSPVPMLIFVRLAECVTGIMASVAVAIM